MCLHNIQRVNVIDALRDLFAIILSIMRVRSEQGNETTYHFAYYAMVIYVMQHRTNFMWK